jgi:hypothetical protein
VTPLVRHKYKRAKSHFLVGRMAVSVGMWVHTDTAFHVVPGSTHSLVATSTHCARTPGGKVVDAVIRRYAYDEASAASGLVCSVDMAAVGVPMTVTCRAVCASVARG